MTPYKDIGEHMRGSSMSQFALGDFNSDRHTKSGLDQAIEEAKALL